MAFGRLFSDIEFMINEGRQRKMIGEKKFGTVNDL